MPAVPGIVAMPTVILNALAGLVPDHSVMVRGPDTVAVVSPMFNEEAGAGRALVSVLEQEMPPDQLLISLNGCEDDTDGVVRRVLTAHGFKPCGQAEIYGLNASRESWHSSTSSLMPQVIRYRRKVAKSESVNNLVALGLAHCDRVLVMDGDTVLHPGFIAALSQDFYRLTTRWRDGRREYVIEDYALQTGAVTSLETSGAGMAGRIIAGGRRAEYALATVVRRGQARSLGGGVLTADSRLFTVTGCGFTARRDLFPVPADTCTEDHDFTLAVQNRRPEERSVDVDGLTGRGFRFVIGDRAVAPAAIFDAEDRIVLRRGGNARYVPAALMGTEDPGRIDGLFQQVERWNGGALENLRKRARAPLRPNVRYALWTAHIEAVVGLLLLLLVPATVALNMGNPSLGTPLKVLAAWLSIDALLTVLLTVWGFWLQARGVGVAPVRAALLAARRSALNLLPYLVIKYLNPFIYIAACWTLVRARSRTASPTAGVTWERPRGGRRAPTHGVIASFAFVNVVVGFAMVELGGHVNPVNHEAWRLIHQSPRVPMEAYAVTFSGAEPQVVGAGSSEVDELSQVLEPLLARAGMATGVGYALAPRASATETGGEGASPSTGPSTADAGANLEPSGVSLRCDPSMTASRAAVPRRLVGEGADYRPLGPGDLLTLARLAPLLAHLETAATAYDVPARLLLKVLVNESYLDPLAVGPTGDLGLSQVTDDALTLLAGVSQDPASPLANPALMKGHFSVFDPDFSICAGAAKLAWALRQPNVDEEKEAYALYINPVNGFVNDRIGQGVERITLAMDRLEPVASRLAAAVALHRDDPASLAAPERELLEVSAAVEAGRIGLEGAYLRTHELVARLAIDDAAMYREVLLRVFGVAVPDPEGRAEIR